MRKWGESPPRFQARTPTALRGAAHGHQDVPDGSGRETSCFESDGCAMTSRTRSSFRPCSQSSRHDRQLEVHLGFVKVYLALGDLEKARHYLDRALKLDATNQDALQYARLLGK